MSTTILNLFHAVILLMTLTVAAWSADDPTPFQNPLTDKEWRALKGTIMVVELKASENQQPKIMLAAAQRVRVVPHPLDVWFCSWAMADNTPVDWHGDAAQPKGFTKQMQIKCYESGGAKNGPVIYDNEKLKKNPWADVATLPDQTWTGPGIICLRGQLSGEGVQGLGRGAIRVKFIPLP